VVDDNSKDTNNGIYRPRGGGISPNILLSKPLVNGVGGKETFWRDVVMANTATRPFPRLDRFNF